MSTFLPENLAAHSATHHKGVLNFDFDFVRSSCRSSMRSRASALRGAVGRDRRRKQAMTLLLLELQNGRRLAGVQSWIGRSSFNASSASDGVLRP